MNKEFIPRMFFISVARWKYYGFEGSSTIIDLELLWTSDCFTLAAVSVKICHLASCNAETRQSENLRSEGTIAMSIFQRCWIVNRLYGVLGYLQFNHAWLIVPDQTIKLFNTILEFDAFLLHNEKRHATIDALWLGERCTMSKIAWTNESWSERQIRCSIKSPSADSEATESAESLCWIIRCSYL